jgi:alkyl sulfatase BDS1-like metallo-beta-lactamase superfamily hydrolase
VFQPGGGDESPAGCEPMPAVSRPRRRVTKFFAPAAADRQAASYELRLGEQRFRLDVADGRIEIARGSAPAPDATIETDPGTLASVLWHGRKLDEARRTGDLAIEGDRKAVTRFVALFPLPTS